MKGVVEVSANAREHDKWKTIGYSIATVGLAAVTFMTPSLAPLSVSVGCGAGISVLGGSLSLSYHDKTK